MSLTPRQAAVLTFLRRYLAESGGVGPTLDEIGAATGISAKSHVHYTLKALEQRGHIVRQPYRQRSLRIIERKENKGEIDG